MKGEKYSHESLSRIAETHGDAFFLLDLSRFRENCFSLLESFRAIYPQTQIAYSVKTNYLPILLKQVLSWGGFLEVVSEMEMELVDRVGAAGSQILFNGPAKTEDSIRSALSRGVILNADSLEEVLRIHRIWRENPSVPPRLGLRCNFTGRLGWESRFGIPVDSRDFDQAVEICREMGPGSLLGLHCHYMPPDRSDADYQRLAHELLDVSRRVFADRAPSFLDIGGGFFSPENPSFHKQFGRRIPSFPEYAKAIAEPFRDAFGASGGPTLVLEPGLAVAADAMDFITRVVDVKAIGDIRCAIVAGSLYDILPTKAKTQLPVQVYSTFPSEAPETPTRIVGYTCMEDDVLIRSHEGPIEMGDIVRIGNVGAYTVVLKPPFIKTANPVLYRDDETGAWRLARRRETTEDLMQTLVIP